MSLLYYLSLPGVGAWNDALFSTGTQLAPYASYLNRAKRALEEGKPALAWRPAVAEEVRAFTQRLEERNQRMRRRAEASRRRRNRRISEVPTGIWVVLEPRPERLEEPEDTFDLFLDAREVHDDPACKQESKIAVREYDKEGRALLLDRLPEPYGEDEGGEDAPGPIATLWLRPNTYALQCQLHALRNLENRPTPRLAPLTHLLTTDTRWAPVEPTDLDESDWLFLTDARRDGVVEQRQFVSIALATPDFALLEGPPGSGKTTAICELVAQLARAGKRVLLVASTHVAVDNVLERLIAWQDQAAEKLLLPLRIGDEQRASEAVAPWIYRHILRTWDGELLDFLDDPGDVDRSADAARALLHEAIAARGKNDEPTALSRLLLESSNLVCGTTIGILQHPTIKQARGAPVEPFDVMILDEASKTTFTEFLVPALHARRWIVVGDVKQLSPYVEEANITANIRGLLQPVEARATVHAFLAGESERTASLIAVEDDGEAALLVREADARGVAWIDLDAAPDDPAIEIPELLYAQLVFGSADALRRHERRLPADLLATGGALPPLPRWQGHRAAVARQDPLVDVEWAGEVAWRLIRWYELRQNHEETHHLVGALKALMPHAGEQARQKLSRDLDTIRRVAMPSILELLQVGFERLERQRGEVALTDGLPDDALADRHVALSFQHRMHPDIARFPREQFYTDDDSLLRDGATMARDRQWTYKRHASRAVWIHVDEPARHLRRRGNVNLAEVECVLAELTAFREWARQNPHRGGPWEAAVLTFYRGQEAALRERLQTLFGQRGNFQNFADEHVHVTLCTVDRFQGHEADIVLLSFVKTRSVGFLNSPNRLNVALTRARYQLVLIGHHTFFHSPRCRSDLLRALAASKHYTRDITWSAS